MTRQLPKQQPPDYNLYEVICRQCGRIITRTDDQAYAQRRLKLHRRWHTDYRTEDTEIRSNGLPLIERNDQ